MHLEDHQLVETSASFSDTANDVEHDNFETPPTTPTVASPTSSERIIALYGDALDWEATKEEERRYNTIMTEHARRGKKLTLKNVDMVISNDKAFQHLKGAVPKHLKIAIHLFLAGCVLIPLLCVLNNIDIYITLFLWGGSILATSIQTTYTIFLAMNMGWLWVRMEGITFGTVCAALIGMLEKIKM
ncbi:hypothetical protein BD410DRAFT_793192 [Rickenella mellea]|uniref:Uncharacterized protein n=1 Tax=Rickenella mellea TaxID=50990 RepID=A0A4Y7PSV1_9AGAM|nr:hypothetical protein BD410DRAFT_793192 [Rickenella mellea]